MKEYILYFTMNGKGYSDTEPWIDAKTENAAEARQAYDDMLAWSKTQGDTYDIWLEARDISPWGRVDPNTLTC